MEIHSDFRPVTLTDSVVKILGGFTSRRLLHELGEYIDLKHFARKGQLRTHALVYLLQAIHGAINPRIPLSGSSFLTNRTQAVCIDNILSEWKHTHGSIPQDTKMGVTLFSIMINRPLRNWNISVIYFDDTTLLELLPCNLLSILNLVVRHMHLFCIQHKMTKM